MHRLKLLNLLENYKPSDSSELNCKKEIIAFVKQNPQCFDRTLSSGHITSSAWLVSQDGEKALLTHHKKLDLWLQLGGHSDGNPDVLSVAVQEAGEESGIKNIEPVSPEIFDIDVHFIPSTINVPGHNHYDVRFLLQVKSDEVFKISDESHDLMWINKDIKSLPTREPSIIRMFNKWCNYPGL